MAANPPYKALQISKYCPLTLCVCMSVYECVCANWAHKLF